MLVEWHFNRLWYADTSINNCGITNIHRMFVIKKSNGTLIIINPIELSHQLQLKLSHIGKISFVIVSSPTYHYTLSEWWLTYKDAFFLATPTVIQTRSDLSFNDALSSSTHPMIKGEVFQTSMLGSNQPRKVIFYDPISHTLLLPDLLIASQPHLPLSQRLYATLCGGSYKVNVPFQDRNKVQKKSLLRMSVQEVLTWPVEYILSSNGLMVKQNAKKTFSLAFSWAFKNSSFKL